jgi:hypothetical protein
MDQRRDKLSGILSQLIQEKLQQAINGGQQKKEEIAKKNKNAFTANIVLDSEFPFGKDDHQKLQAVLFGMSSIIQV